MQWNSYLFDMLFKFPNTFPKSKRKKYLPIQLSFLTNSTISSNAN